jgi:hypothetical protein
MGPLSCGIVSACGAMGREIDSHLEEILHNVYDRYTSIVRFINKVRRLL